MRNLIGFALLASLVLLTSPVWAERPPESREDATHVVVGEVVGVYLLETRSDRHYVVKIVVDKVERGAGVAPADAFYAECFQRKKEAPRIPAANGHKAVPKQGQKIRAFVIRGGDRSEGIYPDWFETAK